MYVVVLFDTEDIFYPAECGIDDIPGWQAEIMTEVGITGTFYVMGEKAQSMKQRGREDVLKKMALHDIGSHQQGNRYPLIPQVAEGKGWKDGVEAFRKYEDWVTEQINDAFGKDPVGFSRHNCYFAPQHVAVGGERGLSYMYMISQIKGSKQPLWYAGAVTFPEGGPGFGGFDRIYTRDEEFDSKLGELREFIDKHVSEGVEVSTVFACHPLLVMAHGWLEGDVLKTGKYQTPQELGWHFGHKLPEEEQRGKKNFKRLCTLLKEHPDVEVIGIEEATRLFSSQPTHIARDALILYAEQLVANHSIAFHDVFSPAELLCGFAESLVHYKNAGDLPQKIERRDILGPVERPIVAREKNFITHDEIIAVCEQLVEKVKEDGHLPANIPSGDSRVSVGQALFAAAKSYLALARSDKYEKITVPSCARYPGVAFQIDSWIRRNIGDHWAMPLDFSCDALAEQARLQTWTMKPAWLRPPQSPMPGWAYAIRTPITK